MRRFVGVIVLALVLVAVAVAVWQRDKLARVKGNISAAIGPAQLDGQGEIRLTVQPNQWGHRRCRPDLSHGGNGRRYPASVTAWQTELYSRYGGQE